MLLRFRYPNKGSFMSLRLTRRLAATTGIAACAVVLGTSPALAGSTQETDHSSFDATGAVFSCLSGDLTVTGGTVNQVMHFGPDHSGQFHYTGTITVHGVTATDEAGNAYTIVGSSWFGGTAISDTENLVATDTAHFTIHNADGSLYATVSTVDHFTLKGSSFSLDFGQCQEPQD
jgi:hypothetical protein